MKEHNTTEQWRDIQGYEGVYQVSNMGKIRSLRNGIRLINPNNQLHVCLYDKLGKASCKSVPRIVAETFLPRKRKCNYVYHINQIPYDNRAENLRWATLRECHRTDRERCRRSVRLLKNKSILSDWVIAVPAQRGIRTRVQSLSARMFRNIATAASDTGIPEASIYLCCAGKKPTRPIKGGDSCPCMVCLWKSRQNNIRISIRSAAVRNIYMSVPKKTGTYLWIC